MTSVGKMKKALPRLDPEYVLDDYAALVHHYRANVVPPYRDEEIERIRFGLFVGLKFFQDNGLLRKTFVQTPADIEKMQGPKVKDLTDEGIRLYRTSYQKYLEAIGRDFTKDPQ